MDIDPRSFGRMPFPRQTSYTIEEAQNKLSAVVWQAEKGGLVTLVYEIFETEMSRILGAE